MLIRIYIIIVYEVNVLFCIESRIMYVGIVYIEYFDMIVNILMLFFMYIYLYYKNIDKKDFEKICFNSVIWIKYIFLVI